MKFFCKFLFLGINLFFDFLTQHHLLVIVFGKDILNLVIGVLFIGFFLHIFDHFLLFLFDFESLNFLFLIDEQKDVSDGVIRRISGPGIDSERGSACRLS